MIYDTKGVLWHLILDEQYAKIYGETAVRYVNGFFKNGKFVSGVMVNEETAMG
jgi:hypothetical protein